MRVQDQVRKANEITLGLNKPVEKEFSDSAREAAAEARSGSRKEAAGRHAEVMRGEERSAAANGEHGRASYHHGFASVREQQAGKGGGEGESKYPGHEDAFHAGARDAHRFKIPTHDQLNSLAEHK